MRVRISLISTMMVLGVVFTAAPTVTAAEPPADVPDGMEWNAATGTLVDPFEVDAARYAKAFGTDSTKQLAQLHAIVDLDKPLAALEADEHFAGSYWSSVGELVVMYRGGAPKKTLDVLRSKSSIKVSGKDVEYSLRDLERFRDDAVAGVVAAGIDTEDIVSGIDPKANKVFVTAQAAPTAVKDSARTKVANRTPAGAVSLSFASYLGEDTADVYGGGKLYNGSSFWCTNGFTVRKSNGTKGTLAAAHCPTVNKWKDWHLGTSTSTLVLKASHLGSWGDMEWYTSGINEKDDFYYKNNGSGRDVEYIKNNYSVGDPISGYGRGGTPNMWNDTVKFIGVTKASASRLVCTKNTNDEGGDSGGPIFNVNVAAGIHKGHFPINGKDRSCFSQTRYVDEGLNVEIFR